MCTKYGVVEGAKYCNEEDLVAMYLANTWESNLSITGSDGLPEIAMAGNVVRTHTSVRLSMRLPPAMDPTVAKERIEKILTTDVPYNAKVTLTPVGVGPGWSMKVLTPHLD